MDLAKVITTVAGVTLLAVLAAACNGESAGPRQVGPTSATTNVLPTDVTPATTVQSTGQKFDWSGQGEMKTAPFTLPSGDYLSRFEFSDECGYYFHLQATDGRSGSNDLGSATAGPAKGETYVYNVAVGEYYIDANTGPAPNCRWAIELTRFR